MITPTMPNKSAPTVPLSERQRPEQLINGNAQSGGIKRISDDGPDACSAVDRHQSGNYGRSARADHMDHFQDTGEQRQKHRMRNPEHQAQTDICRRSR